MRFRFFAFFSVVISSIAACGEALGPTLPYFISGGASGYECPPGSQPDGSCSGPDCSVDCVADTPCDPGSAACPLGTACDVSLEEPYCMPSKLCETSSAQCASGEYCAFGDTSMGICVLVDPTPTNCGPDTPPCAWPFWCTDGLCKLFCNDAECPSGTTCVENRCEPG